jgi:flagellar biosynthesis component FlhA
MGLQDFCVRFANIRKERGLTQEELAVRLGVTPQAISKWERGNSYPDIDLLCMTAQVLECSIDYLLKSEVKNRLTESDDKAAQNRLLRNILAEPLVLEIGIGLVELLLEEYKNKFQGLQALRERLAQQYGILIPLVRIRDITQLGELEYRFTSYDKILAQKTCNSEHKITIADIYNHFEEVIVQHYDRILNRQIVKTLVDNLADQYPAVVTGVIPDKISIALLQNVLVELVNHEKSIRNLIKIIETLEDNIETTKNGKELSKLVMEQMI